MRGEDDEAAGPRVRLERSLSRQHHRALALLQVVPSRVHRRHHVVDTFRVHRLVAPALALFELVIGVEQLVALVEQPVHLPVVEDWNYAAKLVGEERVEHRLHRFQRVTLSPVRHARGDQVRHEHGVIRRPHRHQALTVGIVRVHRALRVDVWNGRLHQPPRASLALLIVRLVPSTDALALRPSDARVSGLSGAFLRTQRIVPRELLVVVVLVLRPDVIRLELGLLPGLYIAVVVVVRVRVDVETRPPPVLDGDVRPASLVLVEEIEKLVALARLAARRGVPAGVPAGQVVPRGVL